MKQNSILVLHVKLRAEVYNPVYGDRDIDELIKLFNEVHGDSMEIRLTEVKKYKKTDGKHDHNK